MQIYEFWKQNLIVLKYLNKCLVINVCLICILIMKNYSFKASHIFFLDCIGIHVGSKKLYSYINVNNISMKSIIPYSLTLNIFFIYYMSLKTIININIPVWPELASCPENRFTDISQFPLQFYLNNILFRSKLVVKFNSSFVEQMKVTLYVFHGLHISTWS